MDSLYKKLKSGALTPEQFLSIIKGTKVEQEECICYYEECLSVQPRKERLPEVHKTVMFISDDIESIKMFYSSGIYFGENVISVYLGNKFTSNIECDYLIDKENAADYIKVYDKLNANNSLPQYMIYFSENRNNSKYTTTKGIETSTQSAYAVTQIIKCFSKNNNTCKFIHAFKENSGINYVNNAISGMLKTVSLEYPTIMHKNICFKNMSENDIYTRLVAEMDFDENDDTDIYFEDNKRFIKVFNPIKKPNDIEHKQVDLLKQGVFIITGGTGALGLILAEQILAYRPQRIYLLGRKHHSKNISDRIHRIDSSDTTIKYIRCDIEDTIACEQAVASILEKDGHITGLFHCAGVIQDAMMINLEIDNFYKCMNPKIKGLINLLDSFVKYTRGVQFVKLYSSITSMLGNIGQTAYSFANGYLNAFAYDDQSPYQFFNIQSICWPYWEQGGLMVDERKIKRLYDQIGQKPLSVNDGKVALECMMEMECKSPLILYGDKDKLSKYMLQVRKQKMNNFKANTIEITKSIPNMSLTKEEVIEYIKDIIGDIIKMPKSKLNITTTWENYGIDSLSIMRFNETIEEIVPNCPKTLMYEYRNILSLSEYFYEKYSDKLGEVLKKESTSQQPTNIIPSVEIIQNNRFFYNEEVAAAIEVTQETNIQPTKKSDIAIVGIAGRYPMANNLEDFWNNLLEGKDCIVEIPSNRWDYREDYNPDKNKHGFTNSKWGGFIDDFDCFDAEFFKITPREARYIDPQERIFLECAWHGLEDAGCTREMLKNYRVGVFAGIMYSHYQLYGLDFNNYGKKRAFNSSYASVANRVSYHMDFNGPSIAIDTMCSSSLTAIYLACESIHNGSSSLAIAGGVNLTLHPNKYINLSQNNFLSSEGKCRSFGEGGDGYVPSEGVGVVILKKLEDAERDNDIIYGVIKAVAINHGGSSNGFTVPNPIAQTEVIQDALKQAKIDATDITYVETHGTGTPLGDPIELSALTKAYGTTEKCPVGSIKSNMGHAESAAGMAGLTKILLQMKNKMLVPSIHCDQLNKNINFTEIPFFVQNKVQKWEHKKSGELEIPYIAGLSAFGAGGSNAHLLVEEYAKEHEDIRKFNDFEYCILIISAKNKKDLINYCKIYEDYLKINQNNNISLEQVCYATHYYRNLLSERVAIIGSDYQDIINKIKIFIATGQAQEDIIYVSEEERSESQDIKRHHYYFNQHSNKQEFINLAMEALFAENYDWSVLWGDIQYPKVNLPLYPFERKRYWLADDWKKPEVVMESLNNASTFNRFSNLSTLKEIKFKSYFNSSEFFIKDHKVKGKLILPGAAIAINARAIGNIVADGQLKSLDNLTFIAPVPFDNKDVELISNIDKKTLEIKTKLINDLHTTTVGIGTLNITKEIDFNYIFDFADVKRRCNEKMFSKQLYQSIQQHGLEYGKSLGIIESIAYSNEEAIVELKTPDQSYIDYFEKDNGNSLIPCIDAAFQSVFVFGRQYDLSGNKVMLPYKIGRIACNEISFIPKFIYVKCNNNREITFDFEICDEKGRGQIKIEKLSLMEITEKENDISKILELLDQNKISLEKAAAILEEELYD